MLRQLFLVLAAAGALVASPLAAQPEFPPLTGRVVDAAGILSPEYEAELTRTLEKLEAETLVQLVVATTPDLEGNDIAHYALALGNAWGIGDAERNDGLILLVAPHQRRVRIEVGLGLEDTVSDEEAAQIIDKDILPCFRLGEFEAGVAKGVNGLVREVEFAEMKEAA